MALTVETLEEEEVVANVVQLRKSYMSDHPEQANWSVTLNGVAIYPDIASQRAGYHYFERLMRAMIADPKKNLGIMA